jgi:hypothetical protein
MTISINIAKDNINQPRRQKKNNNYYTNYDNSLDNSMICDSMTNTAYCKGKENSNNNINSNRNNIKYNQIKQYNQSNIDSAMNKPSKNI